MGWSLGYDEQWKRDIGYGVPAQCDHHGCDEQIDRGLGYVCGGEPYGGDVGCGLYVCSKHQFYTGKRRGEKNVCFKCLWGNRGKEPFFKPSPDVREWIEHKLSDESWSEWRAENPDQVAAMTAALKSCQAASVEQPEA